MRRSFALIVLLMMAFSVRSALASETVGTISATEKWAWSENLGWLNFAPAQGNVQVTDAALTGFVWNENYGWINLAPARGGVLNNNEGNLSGQAWGQNTGWIDFDGVSINSSGLFTGQAIGDISGRINFDCTNCGVQTDWRPASVRTPAEDDDDDQGEQRTSSGGSAPKPKATSTKNVLYPELTPWEEAITKSEIIRELDKMLSLFLPDFVMDRLYSGEKLDLPIRELLPKQAPLSLRRPWNLLSPQAERFALQALPGETRFLAQKYPELGQTLEKVGISRMADVSKLLSAKLALPGFTKMVSLRQTTVKTGRFAVVVGIPVAQLSLAEKNRLPSDLIFARSLGERIDLKTNLTWNDKGRPVQQVATIVGKPLNLVIKPEAPVRKVTGYIVLSKRQNAASALKIPLNTLAASAMFATPELALQAPANPPEKKFVLSEFEYKDDDGDGIYTAQVEAPLVAGEYEVITVMDYLNPQLGSKEIRLIAVVDPEGYVFARTGKYETRISEAKVSIFWQNPLSNEFELWPAREYLQENPQVTDSRGTYSFLVPEGKYYLTVEADGFKSFRGEPFTVEEGNGVHTNIELIDTGLMFDLDWKFLLIIGAAMFAGTTFVWQRRQTKKH